MFKSNRYIFQSWRLWLSSICSPHPDLSCFRSSKPRIELGLVIAHFSENFQGNVEKIFIDLVLSNAELTNLHLQAGATEMFLAECPKTKYNFEELSFLWIVRIKRCGVQIPGIAEKHFEMLQDCRLFDQWIGCWEAAVVKSQASGTSTLQDAVVGNHNLQKHNHREFGFRKLFWHNCRHH